MATVTPTKAGVKPYAGDNDSVTVTWAMVSAATDGIALSGYDDYADRTVQMVGTWGGATLVWEGSLDGTNFVALTDPQGNAISKTADALEAVSEAVPYIRPRLSTAGTGATITAILYAKKAK